MVAYPNEKKWKNLQLNQNQSCCFGIYLTNLVLSNRQPLVWVLFVWNREFDWNIIQDNQTTLKFHTNNHCSRRLNTKTKKKVASTRIVDWNSYGSIMSRLEDGRSLTTPFWLRTLDRNHQWGGYSRCKSHSDLVNCTLQTALLTISGKQVQ